MSAMLRNYLKLAVKVLLRRKFFTFVSLFGIAFTLVVLVVFITVISLPAWLLLGFWFVSQFFIPIQSGVAFMAHIGGFVFGVLGALYYRRRLA